MEVSWMVTGIRHDPYAEKHIVVVEKGKRADQIGMFVHPELYGKPRDAAIGYVEAYSPDEVGE